jgi:1-aminocyclopropane-1-carboxylate deaminase/D-cysteine desulfhydrase-like pyridoxal-dependent ACC family enzyme
LNPPVDLTLALLQPVVDEEIRQAGVSLYVKRLDAIHPHIQGNKWFKLKYNIEHAIQQGHDTLLTFGGAWSNHIYSTAAAGLYYGLKTIGIIRGEKPEMLSTTLQFAKSCGMQLEFISRLAYEEKSTEDFKGWLHDTYGSFHLMPEGGSNFLGINGCMEILDSTDKNAFDIICCAAGTGATAAGILLSAKETQKVFVFPVFKDGRFILNEIQNHIQYFLMDPGATEDYMKNLTVFPDYGFGGYAKWTVELIDFIESANSNYSLPLDQVYTGKMFYGLMDLIRQGHFIKGSKILAIHTGGLQGLESINSISV